MSISKSVAGFGAAITIAGGLGACTSPETVQPQPSKTIDVELTPTIRTLMTNDAGVRIQVLDAEIANEYIRGAEPPGYTEQKDGMWQAIDESNPGLATAISQKLSAITRGLYVPNEVTFGKSPTSIVVDGCIDANNQAVVDEVLAAAPQKEEDSINIVVVNAELCPMENGKEKKGVASYEKFAIIGRDAFTEHGDLVGTIAHELPHLLANSSHAGVSRCEDPAQIKNCTYTAENDTTASPMSYDDGPNVPSEYRRLSAVDAYKAGLLNDKVITAPNINTEITLGSYYSKELAMIIDRTDTGEPVYITHGVQLPYQCMYESAAANRSASQDLVAEAFPDNQEMVVCYSPKKAEYEDVVRVYVDTTDKAMTTLAGEHKTTAVIDAQPKSSIDVAYKPFASGYKDGVVFENKERRYAISDIQDGRVTLRIEQLTN